MNSKTSLNHLPVCLVQGNAKIVSDWVSVSSTIIFLLKKETVQSLWHTSCGGLRWCSPLHLSARGSHSETRLKKRCGSTGKKLTVLQAFFPQFCYMKKYSLGYRWVRKTNALPQQDLTWSSSMIQTQQVSNINRKQLLMTQKNKNNPETTNNHII